MDFTMNHLLVWFDTAVTFIKAHKKQTIIGVAGFCLLIVAMVGYFYYRNHVHQQAHKALTQALTYFDGVVGSQQQQATQDVQTKYFASEAEKWQKVEQMFRDGYTDYKNTALAPMFLAYRSEALLNIGRLDEAIKVLKDALKQIKSEPLKDYYQVKVALMMMDSSDAMVKQEGLAALKSVGDNAQSIAHELALYRLGYYYWVEKKFAEAKSYWQMLLIKYGTRDLKHPSPFVEVVKEKLALLSVETL